MSTISLITLGGYDFLRNKENQGKQISEFSQKIAQKDINRYNKLTKKIAQGKVENNTANWMKEYNKMQDSLKIDSLVKKAYHDGAQMVRDSIKAATKILK